MREAEKPESLARELSYNQILLITILGNARKPLTSGELQNQLDLIFGTWTKYNEIGPMVSQMREKGYDIRVIKHIGYWLPENF